MKNVRLGLLSFLLVAGCNGGVNTVGDTPAVAADEVATEICLNRSSCRPVTISCTTDGEGSTCTAMFDDPPTEADRMECYDNLSMGLVTAFEQADAAGVERADIDACVNASLSQPCISQAEIDAYIAEYEAGNEDAQLRATPPECETLGIPFFGG